MYKSFFGLTRNPFDLSPDPYFILPTEKSKEVLASLFYAICQRKGFVVLTGEVGTGKTLMIRFLLEAMKRQQVSFANIFNPKLSVIDFLRFVAFDLGIEDAPKTKVELLQVLFRFLLVQLQKGLTTVVIVDEAHQLSATVLEEIRLLTNFETAQYKLLQIILVGQPELDKKLEAFELRQLKQRIAVRCRLEPLRQQEICQYIERRLKLAGANSHAFEIFPQDSVDAIYRYSLGIPRLVNSICDQALVAAYAHHYRTVPVEIIDQVAAYFRLQAASESAAPEKAAARADAKAADRHSIGEVIESRKKMTVGADSL